MFSKKKKKPLISPPSNFEHRVHTGFDKREGKFVGLPLQWASLVGNNQILKSTNRPLPLVDPSEITPTEILDLKTIVRGDHRSVSVASVASVPRPVSTNPTQQPVQNGIVLPKTSNVARSNLLKSTSPPRIRRDFRNQPNIPPSVPEESPPVPPAPQQYPSLHREQSNYTLNKPVTESPVEWSQHAHDMAVRSVSDTNENPQAAITYQNIQNANVPYQHNHPPQTISHVPQHGLNGNNINMALPTMGPTITGSRLRYQIGDRVQVNCTSGRSRPATRLAWYVNGEPAPTGALLAPTYYTHEDGLETTSLGLDFKVKPKHFRKGDLKLKHSCRQIYNPARWKCVVPVNIKPTVVSIRSDQYTGLECRHYSARKGFFSSIIENIKEDISKNKEMKDNIKKFREEAQKLENSEALQAARRKFHAVESEASKGSEVFKETFEGIKGKMEHILEEASKTDLAKKAVPPDILDRGTSTDQTVREGASVSLTCAATGWNISFIWIIF